MDRFPSLSIFVKKKFEIEKNKPTIDISTFKTDSITIVNLVFSISKFFTQGWKSVHKERYLKLDKPGS